MTEQGLMLDEKQFLKLPQKEQMCVLYQNIKYNQEKQEEILRLLKGNKLNQKIQYVWLAALTGIIAFFSKSLLTYNITSFLLAII